MVSYLDGFNMISFISFRLTRSRATFLSLVSLVDCTILTIVSIAVHVPVTPRLKAFIPLQPLQRQEELVVFLISHGAFSRIIFGQVFGLFLYRYTSANSACSSLNFHHNSSHVSNRCIACFTKYCAGNFGWRIFTVSS